MSLDTPPDARERAEAAARLGELRQVAAKRRHRRRTALWTLPIVGIAAVVAVLAITLGTHLTGTRVNVSGQHHTTIPAPTTAPPPSTPRPSNPSANASPATVPLRPSLSPPPITAPPKRAFAPPPAVPSTSVPNSCDPATFSVSFGTWIGTAGTGHYTFTAVNHSPRSCRAGGYFGAAVYDRAGHLLADSPTREPTTPTGASAHPITVVPGGTVAFTVSVQEIGPTPCPQIGAFRFIPPNGTAQIDVPVTVHEQDGFCGAFRIYPTTAPTLGQPWVPHLSGYGQVQPSNIDNNGDPTGIVSSITWSSWGGPTAIGTGTAEYVGSNQRVFQGTFQRASIVAFNLGVCDGQLMYQGVEWFFPQHGQKFNPTAYRNICTGNIVGSP